MFDDNDFVCRHMQLTKADIIKVIREKDITSFEDLQDETDVATVCGSCVADIEEILEDEIAKREM
ncbi:(2Fe-2S)-binding protein [Carboxylicivirga sediminis]|uniref:(2Fe-2S)-binding protein n=1 Tax=Carboxylicivirga sediminis TaxID=2006564 RepID=A0A941F0W9_9BACT|nr:(2Fe-2S)-binding protein [Carboxylicivirga sediminis]MBR8534846.1 (2Fe-2S)-binding protein [Carboxylicivirga sediminis]